jgi:hypothetical protein
MRIRRERAQVAEIAAKDSDFDPVRDDPRVSAITG